LIQAAPMSSIGQDLLLCNWFIQQVKRANSTKLRGIRLSREKEEQKVQTLRCDRCKVWLRLEFGSFDKTVGGIRITAPEIPLLVCSSCHKEDLPESTKGYVRRIVQEARSKGTLRINLKTNSEARAFRYKW